MRQEMEKPSDCYGSEGEFANEQAEHREFCEMFEQQELADKLADKIGRMQQQRRDNLKAKIGTEIICPTCGKHFNKRSYHNVFCGKRGKGKAQLKGKLCKDQYWNLVSDTRRLRAWAYS